MRLARDEGWAAPKQDHLLLNWRGPPFSYHVVSFKYVFLDMTRKAPQRAQDEFAGKLVLIGSTAPGLFDIKPTPVSQLHPGVEILATALDNLRHDDFLRSPRGDVLYPLLTLLILWATAWSFYRDVGRDRIDRLFCASQFILVGVSYASLNLTTTYINLTGPVTVGIAFFTIARVYAAATDKALEHDAVRYSREHVGGHVGGLLLVHVSGVGERALERIRRRLEHVGIEAKGVERFVGRQAGVWGLLESTLAVSWVLPAEGGTQRIAVDREEVTRALRIRLEREPGSKADLQFHEGPIAGGAQAQDGLGRRHRSAGGGGNPEGRAVSRCEESGAAGGRRFAADPAAAGCLVSREARLGHWLGAHAERAAC